MRNHIRRINDILKSAKRQVAHRNAHQTTKIEGKICCLPCDRSVVNLVQENFPILRKGNWHFCFPSQRILFREDAAIYRMRTSKNLFWQGCWAVDCLSCNPFQTIIYCLTISLRSVWFVQNLVWLLKQDFAIKIQILSLTILRIYQAVCGSQQSCHKFSCGNPAYPTRKPSANTLCSRSGAKLLLRGTQ